MKTKRSKQELQSLKADFMVFLSRRNVLEEFKEEVMDNCGKNIDEIIQAYPADECSWLNYTLNWSVTKGGSNLWSPLNDMWSQRCVRRRRERGE